MSNWCLSHECDFVATLGDNFYRQGVQSVDDHQFQTSFEDIYQKDGLKGKKWYTIFGNHDYRGNPEPQIEYTSRSSSWFLPSHYYSFLRVKSEIRVKFFMLDTNPMLEDYQVHPKMNITAIKSQSVEKQLVWLENEMKSVNSDDTWKIVIGHHPIFTNRFKSVTMTEKLLPIIVKGGANAYFNGHDHNLQTVEDDILFVTSGTGCSANPVIKHAKHTFALADYHFLYTQIEKEVMKVSVVGTDGDVIRRMVYSKSGKISN